VLGKEKGEKRNGSKGDVRRRVRRERKKEKKRGGRPYGASGKKLIPSHRKKERGME